MVKEDYDHFGLGGEVRESGPNFIHFLMGRLDNFYLLLDQLHVILILIHCIYDIFPYDCFRKFEMGFEWMLPLQNFQFNINFLILFLFLVHLHLGTIKLFFFLLCFSWIIASQYASQVLCWKLSLCTLLVYNIYIRYFYHNDFLDIFRYKFQV